MFDFPADFGTDVRNVYRIHPVRPQLHKVTLYRSACVSDYFSYRIGVSFTLQRSDPVQHVGAKSLRSGQWRSQSFSEGEAIVTTQF